jgi:hypothetical protein
MVHYFLNRMQKAQIGIVSYFHHVEPHTLLTNSSEIFLHTDMLIYIDIFLYEKTDINLTAYLAAKFLLLITFCEYKIGLRFVKSRRTLFGCMIRR